MCWLLFTVGLTQSTVTLDESLLRNELHQVGLWGIVLVVEVGKTQPTVGSAIPYTEQL